MTCDQHDKPNDNVEYGALGFFEFFLVSSRDQHEPTSIYDENHTYNREECVEKCEYLANDPDPSSEIYLLDITGSDRRKSTSSILTSRSPIKRLHNRVWYLDQEEANDGVYDSIIWFFDFFFVSSSRYSDEKCPYRHQEESKSCEHLEEIDYRWEDIDPKLPTERCSDIGASIFEQ